MTHMSKPERPDRTMPVLIAVGVAAVLLGAVVSAGPIRVVLWLAGLLAIAYGAGQYLAQTRRR